MSIQELADGDYARLAESQGATVHWPSDEEPNLKVDFKAAHEWGTFCDLLRAREDKMMEVPTACPACGSQGCKSMMVHRCPDCTLEMYQPFGAADGRDIGEYRPSPDLEAQWKTSNELLAFIDKQFIEAHKPHKDDLDHDLLNAIRMAARRIGEHRISIVQKQNPKKEKKHV